MIKKTFYIWLFDKESKKQEFTTLEAYKIVQKLTINHFWGGTIYQANWIYKHEDGTIVVEPSLVVDTVTMEDHTKFINEVKSALNQESVMYQEAHPTISFL